MVGRLTVLALLVLAPLRAEAAPVLYTFTGNPFVQASGIFTASDFVTGWVVFSEPLEDRPHPAAPIGVLFGRDTLGYSFSIGDKLTFESDVPNSGRFDISSFSGFFSSYAIVVREPGALLDLEDFFTNVYVNDQLVAHNPMGFTGQWSRPQPYVGPLSPVPAPGALALLLVAGPALARRLRRGPRQAQPLLGSRGLGTGA